MHKNVVFNDVCFFIYHAGSIFAEYQVASDLLESFNFYGTQIGFFVGSIEYHCYSAHEFVGIVHF